MFTILKKEINIQTIMDNIGVDQWWAQSDGYDDDELQDK